MWPGPFLLNHWLSVTGILAMLDFTRVTTVSFVNTDKLLVKDINFDCAVNNRNTASISISKWRFCFSISSSASAR